ncbi:MAG: carbon storage regulator [Rhodopirellula sp.]|nr:carbon storage regulator [Rhodopirellula sp.]
MLVLTRKNREAVQIGNVRILILKTGRGGVRLGIEAPPDTRITREKAATECQRPSKTDQMQPRPNPTGRGASRRDRQAVKQCRLSGRSVSRAAESENSANQFRPVRQTYRRTPDAGVDIRLKPGFQI